RFIPTCVLTLMQHYYFFHFFYLLLIYSNLLRKTDKNCPIFLMHYEIFEIFKEYGDFNPINWT
ncbi:MAG: hypothetical protein ACFFDX_14305, partial [Candidatus Odinarchaeota archaeon]